MKNARVFGFCAFAAIALVLSACGGDAPSPVSQSPTPSAAPSSVVIVGGCTSVAPPQLVYPAPGMTSAPDGNFELYVSYPSIPTGFGAPDLTSNTAASVVGGAWSLPSPQPTPTGAATPSMGPEWTSAIPSLAAATTYTVTVRNTSCSQTFSLGTFTTK